MPSAFPFLRQMESLVSPTHSSYNDSTHTQPHPKLSLLPPPPVLSQTSPLKGSALNPPLMLPPPPDRHHLCHQGELVRSPDMRCNTLQPPELPLSSLVAPSSSTLHLPINLDARSLPLAHSPLERPSHLNDDHPFMDPPPAPRTEPGFFTRPRLYPLRTGWTWVPRPSQNVFPLSGRTV